MNRYFVEDNSGAVIDGPFESLSDAVLCAAGHDGWGAGYQRDHEGAMRLYSSRGHVGNNYYSPAPGDAFSPSSFLLDDDEAIAAVAQQVFRRRVFHSRYRMRIVTVAYNDDGQIETVDGETLAERNQYSDDPAAGTARDSETFALKGC